MRTSGKLLILAAVILSFLIACQTIPSKPAGQYDRATLQSFVDKYIDAVIAHDPAQARLAATVKFTENGQRLLPGDGLWNTASERGSYHLYVADPQAGQVGYFGTIRENGVAAIIGLRLKIDRNLISEIETFVVRDTTGARRLEERGAPHPVFAEAIPDSERLTREELIIAANKYFIALERNDGKGEYNFTDDCNRLENGKQTSNNPSQEPRPFDIDAMTCKEQFETGFFCFVTRIRDRRFVVVDEERGLVFAFGFFDHAGNVLNITLTNGMSFPGGVNRPWTWEIAEIFKVEKGLLRQIEALYQEAPYGMNSGWSSWEQGLSSVIQQ